MKYKQALSIGKSEGTMQCTYAILYDEAGNKLFALQRKNFEDRVPTSLLTAEGSQWDEYRGDNMLVPYTGYGKEGIVLWDTGSVQTDHVETGYITFNLPLVAAEKWSEDTLVPAKLLSDAKTYILRTIASAKVTEKGWSARWEKLYNTIKNADVVYVKPAAFNWQPTQIGGSTDIETRQSKLQQAKEKLDRAKAILLAAGAINIL